MVLNPGKRHFMFLGDKENDQFDLICNDITLKHSSHEKILSVTIDNKLSFDEHTNNTCRQLTKSSTLSVEQVTIWNEIKRSYCHPSWSLISAIACSFGCFAPKNQPKI